MTSAELVTPLRESLRAGLSVFQEVWNHKAEEFADPTFVAELEKNRFIKELYEK